MDYNRDRTHRCAKPGTTQQQSGKTNSRSNGGRGHGRRRSAAAVACFGVGAQNGGDGGEHEEGEDILGGRVGFHAS